MVNDAVRRAVCGVANRIIVGLPVCRSEEYFHAVSRWWMCFGLTGLIFRSFIPGPLQRFIMPILSLPTLYWRRKIVDMFEPEVARRLRLIQEAKAKGEPLSANDKDRSNDLMQWLIEQSAHSKDPAEMTPRNLSNKLVLFNLFGKKHTHFITLLEYRTQLILSPASNPHPNSLPHNPPNNPSHLSLLRPNPHSPPLGSLPSYPLRHHLPNSNQTNAPPRLPPPRNPPPQPRFRRLHAARSRRARGSSYTRRRLFAVWVACGDAYEVDAEVGVGLWWG